MTDLTELLQRNYLHNALSQWLIALAITLAVFFVGLTVRRLIKRQYKRYAATTQVELIELPLKVASRTTGLFLLIVATFIGLQVLEMPTRARPVLASAVTIAIAWQIGVWATTAVVSWLARREQASLIGDRAAAGTLSIIEFLARASIWSLVLLLTLDNLGVNITALVAGLGVGGIAVALAVQNILGDLLASLTITLDKPFVLGDFITVDDFKGTVERIGVKSVHLRSVTGEQIIMPNANLVASRIRNFGRMRDRRIDFKLIVSYQTAREKLQRIPDIVRSALSTHPDVRLDRCHFARFGEVGVEFETVYFVLVTDYNRYMDIQQQANFAIHEAFEKEGIEFAYQAQGLQALTGGTPKTRKTVAKPVPQV
jgi:small-conductance mechanosensitive channel